MEIKIPAWRIILAGALLGMVASCSSVRNSDWTTADAPKSYVEFTVTGNPDMTFWIRDITTGSPRGDTTVNRHGTRKIALAPGMHILTVQVGQALFESGSNIRTYRVNTVEGMITPVLISVREVDQKEVTHPELIDSHEYYGSDTQILFNYRVKVYPPQLPYQPL
jgi:hypothetical protein